MAGKNKKKKRSPSHTNGKGEKYQYIQVRSSIFTPPIFRFFLDCIGNEKEPTLDHLEPPYQS